MIAIARLIPVVVVLPVAFGYGSMGIGTAHAEDKRAEENCLGAPNTLAPRGSHWYYRTDRVNQRKCWYLRTEGPAIQEQAAQEQRETGVTARRPTPNTAPDQSGSEPLELRPVEAPPPALVAKPSKEASRPAGVGQAAWPEPPSPARAGQMARPDPPSLAGTGQVAWPEPLSLAGTGQVAWPDPPPAARADKVEWPAPPPPGGGVNGASGENAPKDRARQTQEVPATASISAQGARNDLGADKLLSQPNPSGIFSRRDACWPAFGFCNRIDTYRNIRPLDRENDIDATANCPSRSAGASLGYQQRKPRYDISDPTPRARLG